MTDSQIYIDEQGRIYERQRRNRPWALILAVVTLVLAAAGSFAWLNYMLEAARSYHPPVGEISQTGRPTTPIVQQVVMVIVDGLRVDASQQMPLLGELRARGASATVLVPEPSLPLVTWTTLVSGAGPELNGAPLLHMPIERLQPIVIDNLFRRGKQASLATGLIGHREWEKLIPEAYRDVSFFVDTADAQGDTRITQAATQALKTVSADLLVIHFSRVETAGHTFGVTSPEYFDAILATDQQIREIQSTVDLSQNVLIITAGHSRMDREITGSSEPAVVTTPFIMVGRGVASGQFGTIDQTDIAPTIAALLGTSIPAAAQGAPRFEMLAIPDALRAEKVLAAADQHLFLAQRYLETFSDNQLADVVSEEEEALRIAQMTNELGNHSDAFKLALPTVTVVNAALAQWRAERIAAEQDQRRWPALALGLISLAVLWMRRSLRTAWLLVAALMIFLYPLGNAGLWSSLGGVAAMISHMGQQFMVALLLASICILAYRWWRGDRGPAQFAMIMLPAIGVFVVYSGIFSRTGMGYPLDAMSNASTLLKEVSGRSMLALSLGSLITLVGLWWENDLHAWSVIRATYGFVLLVVALLNISLVVTAWQMGFGPTWYVPDVKLALLQVCLLVETVLIAGIGLFLPAFTLAAGYALYFLARRFYPKLSEWRA